MEKHDVVVIGGGPGGYPAAIRAAQSGVSVGLVEREALGGTCLNWGCIPTKAMIAGSDLFWRMRHASDLGLTAGEASFDYAAMNERKKQVVARLGDGVAQLLKSHGVTVYHGEASFAARNRVAVAADGKEQTVLEAGRTIVATGCECVMPRFLPASDRVMGNREFLELRSLPSNLLILGGGVIGCEFACMAAQLGAKVTIVELLEDILMTVDADVRREVRRHMEKALGIRVLTGGSLEKVQAGEAGLRGECAGKKLEADVLLAAIGRKPMTNGMAPEKAGVKVNEAGFIEIDEFCRTSAATVFAVGDVTAGSTQLAHAATSQGETAAENACGKRVRRVETLVPACIFTAPEIGSVGLTEQKAKEKGIAVRTGKFMFAGLGKAQAAGEASGFVKWVIREDTDQLAGAQAVGPHATELIAEAAVAVRSELTAEELGRTIHCHPTFSESWMEAAHAAHGRCVHQPASRRKG